MPQLYMLKVGVTGGIGSGKTTVCKIFESLGVPVYYADTIAKLLVNTNAELITKIKNLLGNDVYDEKNRLDANKVSALIFTDKNLLKKYNAIVHPEVIKHSEKWMLAHTKNAYCIQEAALLFESGTYKLLDKIICVTAPEPLRIQRVMQRDNVKREQVLARIQNQWSEEEKVKHSDFVIINSGKNLLIPQVFKIHGELKNIKKLQM